MRVFNKFLAFTIVGFVQIIQCFGVEDINLDHIPLHLRNDAVKFYNSFKTLEESPEKNFCEGIICHFGIGTEVKELKKTEGNVMSIYCLGNFNLNIDEAEYLNIGEKLEKHILPNNLFHQSNKYVILFKKLIEAHNCLINYLEKKDASFVLSDDFLESLKKLSDSGILPATVFLRNYYKGALREEFTDNIKKIEAPKKYFVDELKNNEDFFVVLSKVRGIPSILGKMSEKYCDTFYKNSLQEYQNYFNLEKLSFLGKIFDGPMVPEIIIGASSNFLANYAFAFDYINQEVDPTDHNQQRINSYSSKMLIAAGTVPFVSIFAYKVWFDKRHNLSSIGENEFKNQLLFVSICSTLLKEKEIYVKNGQINIYELDEITVKDMAKNDSIVHLEKIRDLLRKECIENFVNYYIKNPWCRIGLEGIRDSLSKCTTSLKDYLKSCSFDLKKVVNCLSTCPTDSVVCIKSGCNFCISSIKNCACCVKDCFCSCCREGSNEKKTIKASSIISEFMKFNNMESESLFSGGDDNV